MRAKCEHSDLAGNRASKFPLAPGAGIRWNAPEANGARFVFGIHGGQEMKGQHALIPAAIDEYTDDLTWELDDGSPERYPN